MGASVPDLEAEYLAALADAEIEQERVRLYLSTKLSSDGGAAYWHMPGDDLVVAADFPEAGQLADANTNRDLHRIVAPAEPANLVTFAALVRHELEHARQFDALGQPIFEFQHFIERQVLARRAGGLNGCAGGWINAVPTEMDCNAAASVFIAGRFSGEDLVALREGDKRNLGCSLVGPEPFSTLPSRMVAYAFFHRACVESFAKDHDLLVAEVLDGYLPGAAALWATLEQGLRV
ncbi:hypothetical protein LRS13_08175 [Svornostia abyssi]|uniref:Uncharacterized protein n=1 Tax=Svornostia abyssi TaxID=2898438 RepID=A0ABY5PLF9_9ACTN|nr:hypothetical protein LRS13_08175 [Parviterribacteraceae bacterium J379]